MADTFKFAQLQNFSLAGAGAVIGATTITLSSFKTIDGVDLAMTDFGTIGFGTLEPGNGTLEEQISFTGVTQNANGTATLTGVSSVLFVSPYTQTSGLAKTHAGATTFVISNTSGFYDRLTAKGDDETITGKWDFPSGANNPTIGNVTYVAPTSDTQIATKKYVDDVASGGTTNYDQQIISGIAGETLTVGQAIYLKTADQRWWRADATSAASSVGVQLGFAESASTAGNSVNILISGPEKNQSSLTPGSDYFLTNTPGTISTTAGTNRVLMGNATSATVLLMQNGSTKGQFAGDSGVPASNNTFVTQKGLQVAAELYAASSGGTDTYAITLSPAPVAYVNGMTVRFKADVGNTGAATLNVNGLGAIDITKQNDQPLVTGDIEANQIVEVTYNSTGPKFQMQSQASTPSPTVDIQMFTGSGTWTKPAGALTVDVYVIGAGGGGGSGRLDSTAANAGGGAGAGGGGYGYKHFGAAALGATEAVVVGAGGSGGAIQSSNATNGNPGTNGGVSSFGTVTLILSNGGTAGAGGISGGNAVAGAGGVVANGEYTFAGGAGGAGGSGGAGDPAASTATLIGPRGGGGGGSANQKAGGNGGGFITNYVQAGGAGGANTGVDGGAGATLSALLFQGGVGGGGGGNGPGSVVGNAGGAGGFPGGGAGGGSGAAATNSGAGAAGAGGSVVVVTYL